MVLIHDHPYQWMLLMRSSNTLHEDFFIDAAYITTLCIPFAEMLPSTCRRVQIQTETKFTDRLANRFHYFTLLGILI